MTEQVIKKVFEALKDIDALRSNRTGFLQVSSESDNNLAQYGGESQGDYDTITEIYRIDADIFLKLTLVTNSYGDGEALASIALVKPVVKQVQEFVEI